jgi:hypothetical protein
VLPATAHVSQSTYEATISSAVERNSAGVIEPAVLSGQLVLTSVVSAALVFCA